MDNPNENNPNAQPHSVFINEFGLYALVNGSRQKLIEHQNKIKVLENNLRKEKYPTGGFMYIIQRVGIEEELFKIGKTNKLTPRLRTYNTTVPDKVNVLYKVKVNNPTAVEYCVKSLLYEYRYISNKEYYKCSLNIIVNTIGKCK